MSLAEIDDDDARLPRPGPPQFGRQRVSPSTRVPPHDLRAEESLLGAMLLSRDAIAAATEVGLSGDDFYKPAHGHIFDAINLLYARGDSVDPVTVADTLRRRELLDAIGGPAILVTLQAGTPATTTAGKYARIVEEHALLRRLIGVAGEIAENAYGLPDDIPATIDRAETLVFGVAQHRITDSTAKIGDLLDDNLNRLEALYERKESITGLPTGYDDLDEILAGLQPSNLVVVGARPSMGKTSFALGLATHAALASDRPVLVFSLEMSKLELSQRILCAEARVDSSRVRTGRLTEADWGKLSHAVGRLAEAPIFIDDNANITVMDIRAKARRLRSKLGDLSLVVIDYVQLMSGRTSAENRQVEVSEISRSLKILARELDTPVVALAQLNRSLEQRADKRPMLSDLRESGCLTADTRLLRADTNAEVTLGELVSSGARDVPVWSLDDRWRLVPSTLTYAFPSGTKETFRLRLASGRTIDATANHKFRTLDDWKPLGELAIGDRLAVPRRLHTPTTCKAMDEDELVLLAHLLGDGCVLPRQPVHYTSADPAKFVPDVVHRAPRAQVALFLHHLWATDGSLSLPKSGPPVRIYYASSSRRLVDDVQRLLLRLDIQSRISSVAHKLGRSRFHLRVEGVEHQRRFLDLVGVHGARGAAVACATALLADVVSNPNVDTIPVEVRNHIVSSLTATGTTHRQLAVTLGEDYCGGYLLGSSSRPRTSSRARIGRMAGVLGDDTLSALATSDVLWDRIVGIEPLGEQPVFDATVLGTHNFVANGVVAHNSLEQDADVVLFLYRDEVYNNESNDRGTAEVIVSKHRNGPVGKIRLAWLDHYTKFANMAKGV